MSKVGEDGKIPLTPELFRKMLSLVQMDNEIRLGMSEQQIYNAITAWEKK